MVIAMRQDCSTAVALQRQPSSRRQTSLLSASKRSNGDDGIYRRHHHHLHGSLLDNIPRILSVVATIILCMITKVTAQVLGEDVCSCAPITYEFTFDFNLTCPPIDVPFGDANPGIEETTCLISSFGIGFAEGSDLVPVYVSSISIIETDINRRPIAQSQVSGTFLTGSSFVYSSIAAVGSIDINQVPKSIQLTVTGHNEFGDTLLNVWAIRYSNNCTFYPLLEEGVSAGWTIFSDLGTPRQNVCPLAGSPTENPTAVSSELPSKVPTVSPTTTSPTIAPTTASPTIAPTTAPTTASPTTAPSIIPAPATVAPTTKPTVSPSDIQPADTAPPTLLPKKTRPPTFAPPPTSLPATTEPTTFLSPKTTAPEPTTPEPTPFMSFNYNLESEEYLEMVFGGNDSRDGDLDEAFESLENEFGRYNDESKRTRKKNDDRRRLRASTTYKGQPKLAQMGVLKQQRGFEVI